MVDRDSVLALAVAGDQCRGRREPRHLPHNVEAEQGLLGALLVDNRSFEKVGPFLRPEHFYFPAHARLYEAMARLLEQGSRADPVTMKQLFDGDADLAKHGGAAYLADLAAAVVTILNVEDYGRTIFDLHLRRQLIVAADDAIEQAQVANLDMPAIKIVTQLESGLQAIAETGTEAAPVVSFREALDQVLARADEVYQANGRPLGIGTGFEDLDWKLGALEPGDVAYIAGRPSMGKTALATDIAVRVAARWEETHELPGGVVAFFSLEMTAQQLAARVLSGFTDVPASDLYRSQIDKKKLERLIDGAVRIVGLPFFIDDTPAVTVNHVVNRARRIKRKHGLGLVVIDYLQIMDGDGGENRTQEVRKLTGALKKAAKQLGVPFIVLSQLSREVERREDKRPILADLRDSGTIEQDADVVMFLYREEYYLEQQGEPVQRDGESQDKFEGRQNSYMDRLSKARGLAEVIVAKQRRGPTGMINLRFDKQRTRFSNFARTA